uniref:Aminopeptidase n=1 Tax=Ciona savignyi TaxID=51511 RepID=H2Z0A6_CIOSA
SNMPAEKKPFSRLPSTVVPVNYNLWLKPCLNQFVFDGKQSINVKVNSATSSVTLNSVDIKIASATFTPDGGATVSSSDISYQVENEKAIIQFPNELATGAGVLEMKFTGELNNKMKGFYRSKYVGGNGEEKFAAVTQFEATDARRCFPCWDPALKATFDTTLVVPKDLVALSNMNVIDESVYSEDAAFKVMKYAQTPVMSTYLLAFVVGEFDYVEDTSSDGVKVRVYTPVGKSVQGQFALEVATKALPFYKDYFDIPYPLAKMDLIAIADFCAGAMENWGLVTYRWVYLVLVTEWWTHLWLNEGFASFMEYLATDHCHPKFDIWTQFVTHDLVRAMDLDALDNSHPIEIPVGHPDEVDEIFDAISYSKGASVIRMLHNWIGDESFRKGMNAYLKKHAYKNAFTEDLWEALGEASGKPVQQVMTTWTKQMGYPVLDVQIKERTDNSITLSLAQSKFRANSMSKNIGVASLWSIPVSFSSSSSPQHPVKSILFDTRSIDVTIDDVGKDDWVKVNPGTYGFYRKIPTQFTLKKLLAMILPSQNKIGTHQLLIPGASSGVAPTTDFLKALAAYENESDYTVWSDVDGKIGTLFSLLWNNDEAHEEFKKFTLKLKPTADKMGWEPKPTEGHLESMLRSLVIRRMGECGCSNTVAESVKRLSSHVSPFDGHCVLSYMRLGCSKNGERNRIERSLGSAKDPELIKEVLDFAMSERVRSNDRIFVIGSVATRHKIGRDLAWKYTKENWDQLHDMYKGMFLISRLVKNTTENFGTDEMAKDVEVFFDSHPALAAERTVQQSIEQIRQKSDWWKRDGDAICAWLKENTA